MFTRLSMAQARENISWTINIPPTCRERFLDLTAPFSRPLVERGVLLAGVSDLGPPYEIGRFDPPYHVVLFTLSGSARCRTAVGEQRLSPGSVWIGAAHQPHQYRAGRRWTIAWFHLDDVERWAALRRATPAARTSSTLRELGPAAEGYLVEAMRAAASSPSASEHEAAQAARSFAELLGIYLDRELGQEPGLRTSAAQEHALAALFGEVDGDLPRRWSVPLLARVLHVSPAQLHRLTQRHYRATPMDVVWRLRMQRAADLLRSANFPLKLIADLVGYETPFALSRSFKRCFGLSPKRYRERCAHGQLPRVNPVDPFRQAR
jgi:AraC-like DNA-binding protein